MYNPMLANPWIHTFILFLPIIESAVNLFLFFILLVQDDIERMVKAAAVHDMRRWSEVGTGG